MKMSDQKEMDPYEALAMAIVEAAADDYRSALRTLSKDPENEIARDEILDIRKFFRSGWYMMLTSIDGEYLIRMLDGEYPDVEVYE